MSRGTQHRRRREKKTDYGQRLKLLKSGEKRLVVRKHLKNIRAQIVQYSEDGDVIVAETEGQNIRNLGWKGNCGNIPTAYLVGYLLGKKAKQENIDKAILDMGLQESTKGNRIYSTVKGVIDAGVKVPADDKILPPEDRINGSHIEEFAADMNKSGKKEQFSNLLDRGLDPENLSEHFGEIKEKIDKEFGE